MQDQPPHGATSQETELGHAGLTIGTIIAVWSLTLATAEAGSVDAENHIAAPRQRRSWCLRRMARAVDSLGAEMVLASMPVAPQHSGEWTWADRAPAHTRHPPAAAIIECEALVGQVIAGIGRLPYDDRVASGGEVTEQFSYLGTETCALVGATGSGRRYHRRRGRWKMAQPAGVITHGRGSVIVNRVDRSGSRMCRSIIPIPGWHGRRGHPRPTWGSWFPRDC